MNKNIESFALGEDTRNMVAYDVDSDGDLDLIGSSETISKSFWFKNDGVGNFEKNDFGIDNYTALHFADLDGDGDGEMTVGIRNSLRVYEIDKGSPILSTVLFSGAFGEGAGDIKTQDMNGDGLLDIAVSYFRSIRVFYNSPSTDFTTEEIEISPFTNGLLHLSDINKDGITDFLMHNSFGRTTVLTSSSSNEFDQIELPSENGRNKFSAFGDLDGDSDVDIFYVEENGTNDGSISVWVNNDGEFTKQVLSQDFSWTDSGGIADIDNDGDLDMFAFTNFVEDSGLITFENMEVVATSATHELGDLEVKLYPNPTSDQLFVESPDVSAIHLRLTDLTGKLILETTNTQNLDLTNLQAGNYLLALTNLSNGFVSKEIIVVQ